MICKTKKNQNTSNTLKVRKDLKKIIADIARMNDSKVKESASIRDDLGVDSLSAMEILASIEKKMGIIIDEAKALNIVTVGDLIDLVMSYIKKE